MNRLAHAKRTHVVAALSNAFWSSSILLLANSFSARVRSNSSRKRRYSLYSAFSSSSITPIKSTRFIKHPLCAHKTIDKLWVRMYITDASIEAGGSVDKSKNAIEKAKKPSKINYTTEATAYLGGLFGEFQQQTAKYHSITAQLLSLEAQIELAEKTLCLMRDHLAMAIEKTEGAV